MYSESASPHIGEQILNDLEIALRAEMLRFSKDNGFVAKYFAHARCQCGSQLFTLLEEEDQACAIRVCCQCSADHFIGDTEDYLDECGGFTRRVCSCYQEQLIIACAVALYDDSNDVRWLYIGAGCPTCQLVGVYVEWKVEAGYYLPFLEKEGVVIDQLE